MNYLYLVLFVLASAVHLYFTKKNDQTGRGITKGLLILLLLGFYLESVTAPLWMLVAALVFSWLGDLLLLGKGTPWFAGGGLSFLISHAFFIYTYCQSTLWSAVPLWVIIVLGVIFVGITVFIFSKLKVHLPQKLVIPMFFYLLVNGCMNCFAFYRLVSNFSLGSIITVVGAILFFISDTSLFFVRFNKESRMKSHFVVMLTYLLGEFLIVLGLVL